MLENVDRLIKSPSKQRGRDFGIMLRCLNDLGYSVEWRVINAGEYGFPQRRRRVYIFAYHKNTDYYNKMMSYTPYLIFNERGLFANTFSSLINEENIKITNIGNDKYPSVLDISEKLQFGFENAGLAINNKIYTSSYRNEVDYSCSLSSIILKDIDLSNLILNETQILKFEKLKEKKKIHREKNGINYYYSEGGIDFPDKLDFPGRNKC